jgi:cytochrome d ubiquinol oxidase subunit II
VGDDSVEHGCGGLFSGVVLYALFGGADFGSGFWDLTAGGPHRGSRLRVLIDHSIGPVWEANHVWLIYILVSRARP